MAEDLLPPPPKAASIVRFKLQGVSADKKSTFVKDPPKGKVPVHTGRHLILRSAVYKMDEASEGAEGVFVQEAVLTISGLASSDWEPAAEILIEVEKK